MKASPAGQLDSARQPQLPDDTEPATAERDEERKQLLSENKRSCRLVADAPFYLGITGTSLPLALLGSPLTPSPLPACFPCVSFFPTSRCCLFAAFSARWPLAIHLWVSAFATELRLNFPVTFPRETLMGLGNRPC